jgi:hypothetical protein
VLPVAIVGAVVVVIIAILIVVFIVISRKKKRAADPLAHMTQHPMNPAMTMSGMPMGMGASSQLGTMQMSTMQMGGYRGAGDGYTDLSRSVSYSSAQSEPRLSNTPISYEGSMPTNADLSYQSARYQPSRSGSFANQQSQQTLALSGDGYTSATTDTGLMHKPSNYQNYRGGNLMPSGDKAAF